MDEEWRPVTGWPGYEVSNLGRVRSWRGHNRETRKIPLFLRFKNHDGYSAVDLSNRPLKKTSNVHRLVMEAFVGPCPEGLEVCHNNGVRTDNRLENLRYDTRSANHADKHLHGTAQAGERSASAKLDTERVRRIWDWHKVGIKVAEMARRLGVTPSTVQNVLSRKTWRSVGGCS